MKRHLLSQLCLSWEGDGGLYGGCDELYLLRLERSAILHAFVDDVTVKVHFGSDSGEHHGSDRVPTCSLGGSIEIVIAVEGCPTGRDGSGDERNETFVVRALPAIHVSEEEYTVATVEDHIALSGATEGTYEGSCERGAQSFSHSLSLIALSPCRVRFFITVERTRDRAIYTPDSPIVVDIVN